MPDFTRRLFVSRVQIFEADAVRTLMKFERGWQKITSALKHDKSTILIICTAFRIRFSCIGTDCRIWVIILSHNWHILTERPEISANHTTKQIAALRFGYHKSAE